MAAAKGYHYARLYTDALNNDAAHQKSVCNPAPGKTEKPSQFYQVLFTYNFRLPALNHVHAEKKNYNNVYRNL